MDSDRWTEAVKLVLDDPRSAAQCLLLRPGATSEELAHAERMLDARGGAFPAIARVVLERWNEDGAGLLLQGLPRFLNPDIEAASLDPAGMSMDDLFPEFCWMIERTEQLAILVEVAGSAYILIAGIASEAYADVASEWAYHLPSPLRGLAQWEAEAGITLSPQMRQMYVRAGGVNQDSTCPFFYHLERLREGILFDAIYKHALDQVSLSAATIERLQRFVVLGDTWWGDSQGFFTDDPRPDGEYTIYEWNHETAEFTRWADDFAGFVRRRLTGP